MLTTMTEEDWAIVLEVFEASRSRRGDKGRDDRKFLEALHYFVVHNITWRALPAEFGNWNSVWKRFWRLSRVGTFRSLLRCAGRDERDGASGADVRFHRGARPCLGGRRKRGQDDQALGRSRGGFSTKIHLKTDFGGLPIAFHLTGGEASDSRNFETLLDIGPDITPRAALGDKGYDAKANREARANAASVRSIPYRSNTNRQARASSRKYSTRRAPASSRPSASSSASSASRCDARRPRRTTAPSSRSLSASS